MVASFPAIILCSSVPQITFDYGMDEVTSDSLLSRPERTGVRKCDCGSENCRGFLPFDES
jgi:hypothetical protein